MGSRPNPGNYLYNSGSFSGMEIARFTRNGTGDAPQVK